MQKNNFTNRVFILLFLLLSLFPYACNNDFFEDHPCCTEAKKSLKDAMNADTVKIKAIAVAKDNLEKEKLNFITKLGDWNAFIRAYVNGAPNSTTRTQQRNLLLAARASLLSALETYVTKSTDRWSTMASVNSATVALATCVRANCPPIDSCCPSEKTAEHTAMLARDLQQFRIDNYNDFIDQYNAELDIIIASVNDLSKFNDDNCTNQGRQQCVDLRTELFFHTSDKTPFNDAIKTLKDSRDAAQVVKTRLDKELEAATKAKDACVVGCPK